MPTLTIMAALTANRNLLFRLTGRLREAGLDGRHQSRGVVLCRWLVGSGLGWCILSCSGDTVGPAALTPSQAFWALRLNQHAVNLALTAAAGQPVNTVQLSATALNAVGATLPGVYTVHYSVVDSSVTVSATGLVTAHYVTTPGQPAPVVASLSVQRVTLTDTALIQVTQAPPPSPLSTFSIQPAQDDSAKRSVDFNQDGAFAWPVNATDATGATVCDTTGCPLQVFYSSSNPLVATIDRSTGQVSAIDTGHVVFTATTLAYGQALRDSVVFTIGYKLNYEIDLTLAVILGVLTLGFGVAPKKLILGIGAVVTFCNKSSQPVDVIFDHPAIVDTASCTLGSTGHSAPPTGSGNIAAIYGDTSKYLQISDTSSCRARRFAVPDTYRYHSSLFPSDTNEIIIQQQR
jgi:hypothetical protein